VTFLTLDPTQPEPPKMENFVTQPDPWMDPSNLDRDQKKRLPVVTGDR